jgi:hypothetical protein
MGKWIIVGLLACSTLAQANDHRDGGWWRSIEENAKVGYVMGYVDGELSQSPDCSKSTAGIARPACIGRAAYRQIADGLDLFYVDSRNRNIELMRAIELVSAVIRGDSPAEVEQQTEISRKE